ncbi:hypothetical protein A165_00940 [Vibrio tasmaniensis ZS-17]|uniref:hypothetical protein n=1 Tax=Vibrio tasmaniensis TaxID=212663 RepID=UPI000364318D|nr:hypothetical protein [Vibrio tasmaniensis]OED65911.1 hypothetical protein A165_00940 [Vibrio tasmaniensis ZS-17]
MDIRELKERMNTEYQSGHFKLQSIFERYLPDIESLLKMGMKHKSIHSELSLGISLTHYNNILLRARKKTSSMEKSKEEKTTTKEKPTNQVANATKEVENLSSNNIEEWITTFDFVQPVKITGVLKNTINTLENAGWDTTNFHILKEHCSINTMRNLIDVVSIIRSSKFKRNVFKDNKACF